MMILSIFLGIAAIGFCCWLLFILAIFALPAFAGVTIGLWAHHAGAGVAGGIAVDAFLSHNWRANMRPTCRTTNVALAPALVVFAHRRAAWSEVASNKAPAG